MSSCTPIAHHMKQASCSNEVPLLAFDTPAVLFPALLHAAELESSTGVSHWSMSAYERDSRLGPKPSSAWGRPLFASTRVDLS